MNSFGRLLPYVWPHRSRLMLSVLFAGLVALFWGLNLSFAFPVIKVLLQDTTLEEYVNKEIAESREEIAAREEHIQMLEARAAQMSQGDEHVRLLKTISRQQTKQSEASRNLLIMGWTKENVLPWVPRDKFDTLALILGVLLAATVIKGVCLFIQDLLIGSVVELSVMGIRKECFRRVLKLDYQSVRQAGTPELMSRFTYDMEVLGNGLNLLGGKVVREPLKALTCVILAFFVNWQLTLLSLLFVPLAGVIFYRIGKKLKQASHRVMESMSRIYKTLEETFEASKIVIAFDGSLKHRRRFHRENKQYIRKAIQIVRIDAITSPTTEVLGMLAAFVALLPGAYLVLRETREIWGIKLAPAPMDIAELSLMYVLLAGVIDPARKLSSVYSKLKRSTAAADRIFQLMDQKPLVNQAEITKPIPRLRRSIEFRDVHFAYHGKDDHRVSVLNDVNLTIPAGEVVAVVGENGSGKSTLLNLLPRYFDPDQGAVLFDEVDIRDVRLRHLRAQIGVVTQETQLFDESVFENIRYGNPAATPQEVIRAASQAHALRFIEELPDGFETRVGEKGQRLSGGQRQRIALARAMLRNPSILILDEATSAIDSQSELLIHQALKEFCEDRTVFLITHSVTQSILEFVTMIAVMDEGRLCAAGPHEQLLKDCPKYRELYRSQVEQRAA